MVISLAVLYRRIERMPLFLVIYLVTIILGLSTILPAAVTMRRFHRMLKTCIEVATLDGLPLGDALMIPARYEKLFSEVLPHVAIFLMLHAMWFYLWLRRREWLLDEKVSAHSSCVKNALSVGPIYTKA